jgi:hypothetical protein
MQGYIYAYRVASKSAAFVDAGDVMSDKSNADKVFDS